MEPVTSARRLHGARVLITGATGFLGMHVASACAAEGATVTAIRRTPDREPVLPLPEIAWLIADLTDAESIVAAVHAAEPDIVLHLAAYGARGVERDEARMFAVNVTGTMHLLRALSPSMRLVMAGTSAEYGNLAGPAREDQACHPVTPYASTKHAAVVMVQAQARLHQRPLFVLRPYGPFGPGDDPARVLPAAIAGLIDGEDVALGDGTAIRDFSYVGDHAEAFVRAAVAPDLAPGSVFNIGSGYGMTVRDALERASAIVKGTGRLMFGARPAREGDAPALVADVEAARRRLGFQVRTTFEEGVARTAAFMRTQRGAR